MNTTPVRILYFYSSTHMDTGSPKALVAMVDSLDRARFEPMFLAPSEGPLCDEMRKRNVTVLRGQSEPVDLRNPLRSISRIRALRRLLREHRVGVVHMNEFGWNSELAIAARRAGSRLVLHFHNPGDVAPKNLNWRLASRVLLVSEQQKETIGDFQRIRDKATVLPNAIDVGAYGGGRSIRESLDVPGDAVVIGTIAQVGARKGIDFLLETARLVVSEDPRALFLVVGPDHAGEETFAASMRELASSEPLRGRVRFIGSRKDVPDLLASMDIFFLPTRAEPFGLVVAEAMAAGVPVVASRVGGIPEIVRSDNQGLLVDAGECAEYASRILQLAESDDLRRQIGEAGRARVMQAFDLPAIGARLAAIYGDASTRLS